MAAYYDQMVPSRGTGWSSYHTNLLNYEGYCGSDHDEWDCDPYSMDYAVHPGPSELPDWVKWDWETNYSFWSEVYVWLDDAVCEDYSAAYDLWFGSEDPNYRDHQTVYLDQTQCVDHWETIDPADPWFLMPLWMWGNGGPYLSEGDLTGFDEAWARADTEH